MTEEVDVGTDAYTQGQLEDALGWLESQFYRAGASARRGDWQLYRKIMRDIDLRYRQLRSQGPALGAEPTRQ